MGRVVARRGRRRRSRRGAASPVGCLAGVGAVGALGVTGAVLLVVVSLVREVVGMLGLFGGWLVLTVPLGPGASAVAVMLAMLPPRATVAVGSFVAAVLGGLVAADWGPSALRAFVRRFWRP